MISFGRELCGSLDDAESREWLVTNGMGGFASGTLAGSLARRYHGILIAALPEPIGRLLLVAKVDETLHYNGKLFKFGVNRWIGGAIDPHGFRHIESFSLIDGIPTWRYTFADALIEKSIWMKYGENTTYIQWKLVRAEAPVEVELVPLVNYRHYHSITHGEFWGMRVEPSDSGLGIKAFPNAIPFYLFCPGTEVHPIHDWYVGYELSLDRARGLESQEDHLAIGNFRGLVTPGQALTFIASTLEEPNLNGDEERKRYCERIGSLKKQWRKESKKTAVSVPAWVEDLVVAADQFVIQHHLGDSQHLNIIAGYHWFEDWCRDTMISIDGLLLRTGRLDEAKEILTTYIKQINRGLLPVHLPAAEHTPEHQCADASLWFVDTVRSYWRRTKDRSFLKEVFPAIEDIIRSYLEGTLHNIKMDQADGLIYAGEQGIPLTWMDALINDVPVTPRIGKTISENALWYNALCIAGELAKELKISSDVYDALAEKTKTGMSRFWNGSAGYCNDIIDCPEGYDASLRPNQIFTVSLPYSALSAEHQRAVVETCARELLTSYGLRTLAPGDPRYRGLYSGDAVQRDLAYHQGTAWGWLMGPFVVAHLKVFGNPTVARTFLDPFGSVLSSHGIGTLGEIFNGDPPHRPKGCIAQAWTVAEILRAWHVVEEWEKE
jgi:predicted glycogen debranching enzyme